jgi:phosphate transport system permease protein
MTTTATALPAPGQNPKLRSKKLPTIALLGIAVVALGLSAAIVYGAGIGNWVLTLVIGLILYLIGVFIAVQAVEGRRSARNRTWSVLIHSAFVLAVLPLISVVWTLVSKGADRLDGDFFNSSMNNIGARDPNGGAYHAIIGTLEQVGIATAIAAPIGLLTAVYLVEYGRGGLAKAVTFFVDVMTGVPSIVAGLFILTFWIIILDFDYSGFAGAMALAILMMPIVVRSTEEMLKLVPNELREASLALGVPKWRTILKVVLPTAIGGIITGVMLAVARIAGESAPIVLLVFGAQGINNNPFDGAQSSLPYYVYEQWQLGNDASYNRAWAAALVLIAFVMILNLLARGIARWKAPKTGR